MRRYVPYSDSYRCPVNGQMLLSATKAPTVSERALRMLELIAKADEPPNSMNSWRSSTSRRRPRTGPLARHYVAENRRTPLMKCRCLFKCVSQAKEHRFLE